MALNKAPQTNELPGGITLTMTLQFPTGATPKRKRQSAALPQQKPVSLSETRVVRDTGVLSSQVNPQLQKAPFPNVIIGEGGEEIILTPRWLINSWHLSAGCLRLFMIMQKFAGSSINCQATQQQLADFTGKCRRTVNRQIRKLEEGGYIEVTRQSVYPYIYYRLVGLEIRSAD